LFAIVKIRTISAAGPQDLCGNILNQSVLDRVTSMLMQFLRDRRGNVAPMFALAVIPVIGFVGAAVDYSRASSVRSEMQSALDATALMLSKEAAGQTNSQLTTKANAYFQALFNSTDAQGVVITASQTSDGGSALTVSGSGSVPTSFTKVMGFSSLPFKSSSTVKWGSTKLRVALALDNTGSMSSSGKMTALKSATKGLLTILQGAATTAGDVQVSIVPFAKDVNFGNSVYNETWLDWTDWESKNGTCSISGNRSESACKSDGVCSRSQYSSKSQCTSHSGTWTAGVWTPESDHRKWTGCVADRTQDYDVKNTTPSTLTATKFVPEQYSDCPTQVLPLTYDWTALGKKVDDMQPAGNTNITIGLATAWQTLAQGVPFNAPALQPDMQQIIILLTDGDNTESRDYKNNNKGVIDARTQKACDNVKAAGVTIYTVLVMQGNASLLQNCATKTDMYFGLTSSNQLVGTFNQIGTNLAKLRIAK
jgi:Flp pilus assembly protein TadG